MASITEHVHPSVKDDLIAKVKELSATDFVSRHLLERVPWLFSDRDQYVAWKAGLATDLEVDPFMLLVVGSACLGFSLAPYKGFAGFGLRSDVDVAVVSQRHFDEAWRWLRGLGPDDLIERDEFEREMFEWHRRNLVFDGAIATERLLPRLPFGSRWATGLGRASTREPATGHTVKARIYRDFESLRTYHLSNVRQLKLRLIAEEVDTPPDRLPGRDGEELGSTINKDGAS